MVRASNVNSVLDSLLQSEETTMSDEPTAKGADGESAVVLTSITIGNFSIVGVLVDRNGIDFSPPPGLWLERPQGGACWSVVTCLVGHSIASEKTSLVSGDLLTVLLRSSSPPQPGDRVTLSSTPR